MSEGTKRSDNKLFNSLYKITVNDVVEKRNKLTYLSWAWAWAEVSKICEEVDYEIYRDPETHRPYLFDEKTGYMVFTSITVNGVKRDMWLPVMDGANKAMKDEPYTYEVNDYQWNNETKKKEIVGKIEKRVEAATMFDINKTIMRCLVKNLAMFGLGLYYQVIKWTVLTVLPAASVLVATLGKAYGWNGTDMTVLTINAVATFLGVITGVSAYNLKK